MLRALDLQQKTALTEILRDFCHFFSDKMQCKSDSSRKKQGCDELLMNMEEGTYTAIDLKSFYASVECHARQLSPVTSNLIVAETRRSEKTICLAVSPSLKAYGIPGRARLFEVIQAVEKINRERQRRIHWHDFCGSSTDTQELAADPYKKVDYIAATPRMAKYIQVSSQVYGIDLRFIATEDIHVYSIDEVFLDATTYLVYFTTI